MRRLSQVGLAVAVLALTASPVLAQQQGRRGQGGGGGGGEMALLTNKGVQEDLKLSEDQVKKLTAVAQKQREARQGLRDLNQQDRAKKVQEMAQESKKAIDDTLKPEQKKRLHQLVLQQQGVAGAMRNPEAAKELNITDEQRGKIRTIQQEAMQGVGRPTAGGDIQEFQKKFAEANKMANEKIMGVLTADQKAKWKEMTGEPFKGTLPPAFGFGGGAGRRPGGAPPRNDK